MNPNPGSVPAAPQVSKSGVVRCVNQEILGMSSPNNLIAQILPATNIIREASYQRNKADSLLDFGTAPGKRGRLGIFGATKRGVERGVILLLPESGKPDSVLISITQQFAQAADTLDKVGWGTGPLAAGVVQYALLKHVINRYGAQLLASRKQMALMYILRAKGDELGPFAADGEFVAQVLSDLQEVTNNAFHAKNVEAFTYSSGIYDFNKFLSATASSVNFTTVYSIDPVNAMVTNGPPGAARKQFTRQRTGPAGFDCLPVERWVNEPKYPLRQTMPHPWPFNYMHNHCMPNYALYLGLQT